MYIHFPISPINFKIKNIGVIINKELISIYLIYKKNLISRKKNNRKINNIKKAK